MHSPGHGHHGHSHPSVPQALNRALLVTLVFMFVEFAAGYYANSLALISDAAHMATDVGAMGLSLVVYQISRKPRTPTMTFGYQRAEILGALVSGVVIWILVGFLVYEAILRLREPPAVMGPMVFVVALIGLAANLISMRMLHATQSENLNVRAAYLHMVTDCLGSLGAVIAGGVLWATGWRPIDPIVTLVSAGLMIFSSWDLVKEAVSVLMEGVPRHIDSEKIQEELETLAEVTEVHDLHVWTVSSGKLALSVHLISSDTETVLVRANALLQERFGIIHTTIQVEHPDRFSSDRCYDCAEPSSPHDHDHAH